jgi:hypothetical protein
MTAFSRDQPATPGGTLNQLQLSLQARPSPAKVEHRRIGRFHRRNSNHQSRHGRPAFPVRHPSRRRCAVDGHDVSCRTDFALVELSSRHPDDRVTLNGYIAVTLSASNPFRRTPTP